MPGTRVASERTTPIGREGALVDVDAFLASAGAGPTALFVEGEPGMGRTTVWSAALERAGDGFHRLTARPGPFDGDLAFATLGDLLRDHLDPYVGALPAPQADAVRAALLLEAPGRSPGPRHAASLGVLGLLRAMAEEQPVLVAIDDLASVDEPTARVLAFVARRLEGEPVGFLATLRAHEEHDVALGPAAFPEPWTVSRTVLGPLAQAALGRLIEDRLGFRPPAPLLRAVRQLSDGNPLFALELARAAGPDGTLDPGTGAVPVPDSLRGLLGRRLAGLSEATSRAVLALAAMVEPDLTALAQLTGGPRAAAIALDEAVRAGVLEVEAGRARFAHPLFATVAYANAPIGFRLEVHGRLASLASGLEERARHLALSTLTEDAGAAETLDAAAAEAFARGAPDVAARFAEHARRLTPAEASGDAERRALDAAEYHFESGDPRRAAVLLGEVAGRLPPGPARADVLRRLARVRQHEAGPAVAEGLYREALAEAGEDTLLRALIERGLAWTLLLRDVPAAAGHARSALELAESAGDEAIQADALTAVGLLEFLSGTGVTTEDLEAAFRTGGDPRARSVSSPAWGLGQVLKYTDRLDEARQTMAELQARALARGDESSLPLVLLHLSELETWAGRWDEAMRLAREGLESARETGQTWAVPRLELAMAFVHAYRGDVEAARAGGAEALADAEARSDLALELQARWVLGFVELSLERPDLADAQFALATRRLEEIGVRDPGVFRFLPDEVEALIGLGRLEQAEALLDGFEDRATALGRTWARGAAARNRGLLASEAGRPTEAMEWLDRALDLHGALPLPFELARTLLASGTVRRRAKQKQPAREPLRRAADLFASLGASIWEERARRELGRIGGRVASPDELSPTERQVVDLAAAGHTNREIAGRLHVSVRTVETNLTHAFRKLGVTSRRELRARATP
jgi:DNA-binding CsgD family transcriptional regulator